MSREDTESQGSLEQGEKTGIVPESVRDTGTSSPSEATSQKGKWFFQEYPLPSLFLALVLIGSLCGIYFQSQREMGTFANVRVSGEDWLRLDVSNMETLEEHEIFQTFPTGEAYHRLVVGQGDIRIIEANCPDQVCVLQGGAVASGRPVVCLPFQVVITMEQEGEFDAVTG